MAAFDMLAGGEHTLGIAVSGGSDSLGLLALAAKWARKTGARLEAATVDHGLRPEAASEASEVERICDGLGVSHLTLVWRPNGPASQATARQARHRLLAEWARARRVATLALGHTREDRIETFLIRARAGSHWHGLAGPMPSGASPVWPDGAGLRLVRPLLGFSRGQLRTYLSERDIGWVEDPSNSAARYERVRMRALATRLDEASRTGILRTMNRLAGMRAAVASGARMALQSVDIVDREARLDAAAFRELGAEVRTRLLEALVLAAGGAAGPLRRERLARLVNRMTTAGGLGGGATLGGAHVRERKGVIRIGTAPARGTQAAVDHIDVARAAELLADPSIGALDI